MLFHLTESTYHSLKVSIDPVSTLSSENSQKKALCSPDYCPPSHLTVFLEKALYLCDDITSNDKKTWRNSRHCRCSMDVSEHASFLYRHRKLNLLLQPLGNRIPVECHCTFFEFSMVCFSSVQEMSTLLFRSLSIPALTETSAPPLSVNTSQLPGQNSGIAHSWVKKVRCVIISG